MKKLSSLKIWPKLGFILILIIGLGRCGFEAGAFSSVNIEIPNELALSSLAYANDSNPLLDEAMPEYYKKIQSACWKSGWRGLIRSLLYTGPSSIQLTVSDIVTGTRTATFPCKDI